MNSFYRSTGKRIIDLVLSGVGTIVLAPDVLFSTVMILFNREDPHRVNGEVQSNALKEVFLHNEIASPISDRTICPLIEAT
ncbi:MAG: hypothetical protein ACOX6O_02970 [Christensenellales bacterium]|jgi:hypothetical protein